MKKYSHSDTSTTMHCKWPCVNVYTCCLTPKRARIFTAKSLISLWVMWALWGLDQLMKVGVQSCARSTKLESLQNSKNWAHDGVRKFGVDEFSLQSDCNPFSLIVSHVFIFATWSKWESCSARIDEANKTWVAQKTNKVWILWCATLRCQQVLAVN